MSNATFSRKPLVAAVLTTLAVFSTGAMAANGEQEVNKDVKLTVGTGANTVPNTIKDEKTWDEDWAKTFNKDFTNASGKVTISTGNGGDKITISKGTDDKTSGKLTNKLSSLTLNVGLDVNEGGTFVNNGTLEANKAITVDGSLVNTGTLKTNADLTVTGGFDNAKGTIEVTGTDATSHANVMIHGLNKTDDLEAAPASVVMGDITLKNATLTNNDKGYKLKTEADKKEGADDKTPETRARVSYGNVTLKTGGKFFNAKSALDSGSSLTIASDAVNAEINGKSTWGTIKAQKKNAVTVGAAGTLSADHLVYDYDAGTSATIADLVFVTEGGTFTVNKGLTVSSFAQGGSFGLSKAEYKYLASGASLTFGKAQAFKQVDDAKGAINGQIDADGDYHQGNVTLSNYEAVWKEETATSKTGTEGDAKTDKKGSWDVTKFGSVTVYNNARLTISNNKAEKADDLTKHGYSASLSLGNLTLNSTVLKVTPSFKVEKLEGFIQTALKKVNKDVTDDDKMIKLDTSKWTKDDYAKNLEKFLGTLTEEQKETFTTSYDHSIETETAKLAIDQIKHTDATQTITGSDIAIGSITFKTVESLNVPADMSKFDEPVTTADGKEEPVNRGSVTVDAITQAMGTQTLKIEDNSRVEVGSLSLGDGTLHITGSDVIIHKTDKINGTLTAESGYLGLNVATTMADKVKADTPSTTGTTQNFVLEVGAPVVFGEDAKVTFGGPATNTTAGTDADKVGAELTFAGATTLKFDAANFNRNALFTAEGTKGKIDATGTINLEGSNLTWGAYKLFENFDQSGIAKEELTFTDGKLTAADAWKNQVGDNFTIEKNSEGEWMIVAGGKTVEGSGLNVSAKNLVSKIFAGERSTGPDTQLINQILSTGASLQEISSMINSVTGLGAISGVKAMTVDFQGYTADMIEHHAATMPREMGGWWVQPMGARLKTDDLSMGGSAYGYSLDTYGIMGGFDTHLKNGWTIGAAASYQSGDADGEGDVLPVSTDVKNVGLHLWGSRMYGETNVIGTLSYVTTDGDVTMQLGNLELASELKAKALSAGIRAEREFKTGAFTLTPHAGARISIVDMDDYEIAAGTTKLFDVSEDKATIFEVPVGVTVQTPSFMFQTFEVKPYVDVTLRGRFGDTESSYTLEGSSTTDTIDYDVSGSFVGDLKVGYMSTYKNLNLGMSYGLSAGDAGRQNHAIEATMRVDF